ncbi:MAG: type II RES/Xre toxin-antitoxin system antitoxin [Bryobacteraceae bacterium]
MAPWRGIAEILGGRAVLGRLNKPEDLREAVRAGLPLISLHSLQESLQLSREGLSRMLSMPERTLARRQKQARLTADESDRLIRVARVMAHAIQVLGSRDKAVHWLRTGNRALDGTAPLSLLDTDVGTEQVSEILGRIEHGIYS